jgi:hypothetical protein
MGAWDDAHDPTIDIIVRLETAGLQAQLEEAEERAYVAEIQRDFAREILVDAAARTMQEQPKKRLRAV